MTTFCVPCFFFYSFTTDDSIDDSDGSEGTTACRVVSPRSIILHHGFRNKEVRHARKQNIDYANQHHTLHRWLPAKVMCPAYFCIRFSWLTRSASMFFGGNVQIYIYIYIHRYIYTYPCLPPTAVLSLW